MANIGFNKLYLRLKLNKCLFLCKRPQTPKLLSRKSHALAAYRELNYEPNRPWIQRFAHINAGFMWCYIYWSFRHNWRELVGEYIWPERSGWSDQHLGIPPDDYD